MISTKKKQFENEMMMMTMRPHRKTHGVKTKEIPPPLTTSLIKLTGHLHILLTKQCHFVRRCSADGKRLVVCEVQRNDDKNYHLRVNRADGRLVMSIVPMDKAEETHRKNYCDDDDNGDDESEDFDDMNDDDDLDDYDNETDVVEEKEEKESLVHKFGGLSFESIFNMGN